MSRNGGDSENYLLRCHGQSRLLVFGKSISGL